MKFQQVNLNNHIKVKLTEKGLNYYLTEINKHSFFLKTIDELKTELDSEGYFKMQTWFFIDVFGGLGMSLDIYLDVNIFIEID